MKTGAKIKSFALVVALAIIAFAATVQVAVSETTLNDNLNITGKVFLEGLGCGINYPDGSRQTSVQMPPWNQRFSDDRFELVLDDEAVLDRETGLVWQKAADDTKRDWYKAQEYCYKLKLGGRMGWYLPTIYELQTLIDSTQSYPALPVEHLFVGSTGNLSNYYWSSTTFLYATGNTDWARIILFANGDAHSGLKTDKIYYNVRAVRSWGPKISEGRFVLVLDDEAVLDRETGLVWQKSADDVTQNWYEAQSYCYTLELGGRKGWRLPTIDELTTLIDPDQTDPALPGGHPFTGSNLLSDYWSSTTDAYNTSYAWRVGFYDGGVGGYGKSKGCYVRAVRSGQ